MKNVTLVAPVDPHNTFAPEHVARHFFEEGLKSVSCERRLALERDGVKSVICQMIMTVMCEISVRLEPPGAEDQGQRNSGSGGADDSRPFAEPADLFLDDGPGDEFDEVTFVQQHDIGVAQLVDGGFAVEQI